ncbi:MAG: flagellar hook-length control protein FliK [Solirubrobacterales bacterium]
MEVTKVSNVVENFTKDTASTGAKEKNNGTFDKMVAKATDNSKPSDKAGKDNTQNGNIKSEDADLQKSDSSKTAEVLQSEDIKSIDDLIKAIDALINQDNDVEIDSKDNLSAESMNLLNMLSMLLKSIKDPLQNAQVSKDNIISALQGNLNLSLDKSVKINDIINKLTTEVSNIKQQTIASDDGNSVNNIKKEIFALLNSIQPQKNIDKEEDIKAVKSDIVNLKELLPEIKQALASNGNEKGKEKDNTTSDKKGDELLKNLASDKSSDNGDLKINNLMARFNVMKSDNTTVVKEPNVINQKNFAGDIIKTLKYMDINNIKEMTVKINPKELGEVLINVTMESGVMKATISASNKEAYNLIQGNLQDINARLNSSEVKVSNLSLNIYNDDTTFYRNESGRENNQQNNSKRNDSVSSISIDDEDSEDYTLDGNVNRLA